MLHVARSFSHSNAYMWVSAVCTTVKAVIGGGLVVAHATIKLVQWTLTNSNRFNPKFH